MSRVSMLRSVFLHTIRKKRRSILSWGIGLSLLVGLIALAFPAVRDQPEFADLLENYPEPVLALLGVEAGMSMTTASGYMNVELFQFMLPLMFLIITVGMGASAIAGEEDSGTIDLLMSMPLSRTRVYIEKLLGIVVVTVLIAALLTGALIASVEGMQMDLRLDFVVGAVVNVVVLALFFGAMAYGLSAATGNRSVALAVTTIVAVVGYFLDSMAPLIEGLDLARQISPFYYYGWSDPLETGLDPVPIAVLVAWSLVFVVIGLIGFRRRDLAA